jgi:hypothetical protein
MKIVLWGVALGEFKNAGIDAGKPLKRLKSRGWRLHTQLRQGVNERAERCLNLSWAVPLIVVALVVVVTGCQSPPSGAEGSIAWVTVTNHTPAEITDVAKNVFVRNGFKPAGGTQNQLTFERPGSTWDDLEQGGWGEGVTVQVEVTVTAQSDSAWLLHCKAWLVRNPGDRILEDKHELTRMRSGRYQKLLEDAKKELAAQ